MPRQASSTSPTAMVVQAIVLSVASIATLMAYNTIINVAQPPPFPPMKVKNVDSAETARRISEAIQFKTISYERRGDVKQESAEAFLGLHKFFEREFPLVHEKLKREIINEYTLLYRWDGSDLSLRPYLLMSHLDVVPVQNETDWTYPPFSGKIADGYIWGRGALDDKMGVLQILEAIEMLLQEGFHPTRTVYLSFGHDEEVSGYAGNGEVAKLLAERNIRFEYVLDEGGSFVSGVIPGISKPIAYVAMAEKGYTSITLEVKTTGGHSSMPPSEGAISIISKAIHKLQENPMPTRLESPVIHMLKTLSPHMDPFTRVATSNLWLFGPVIRKMFEQKPTMNAVVRTTLIATMMQSGIKDNVIPDRAQAVLNSRILPGDSVQDVVEHVRRTIDDPRVNILFNRKDSWEPSEISHSDSKQFEVISHTIGQLYPDSIVAASVTMGATDGRWYQHISPKSVYRFSPMELMASDLARIHGVDERISVENHARAISFYYYLIRNSEAMLHPYNG